jgi:sialate O-acetylesterase
MMLKKIQQGACLGALFLMLAGGALLSCEADNPAEEPTPPEEEQPAPPILLGFPVNDTIYDLAREQKITFVWREVEGITDYALVMSLSDDLSDPVVFITSATRLEISAATLNDSLIVLSDYDIGITHKVYWSVRPASAGANAQVNVRALTLKRVPGKLAPAAILGNNMVVQRNTETLVWGAVTSSSTVAVSASWGGQPVVATVTGGNWAASLNTPDAGGPYTVTIEAGAERIKLKGVMSGEVWLAAGQSNMALELRGNMSENQPVEGSAEAIAGSAGKNIRFVPNWGNEWVVADPATVGVCSAVGWFFADALHEQLGVPIGIINASVGATKVEQWMPKIGTGCANSAPPQYSGGDNYYSWMILLRKGFAVKGAIWYQGESNQQESAATYTAKMKHLAASWRCDWGRTAEDFPFYYTQIAPFGGLAPWLIMQPYEVVYMRETQWKMRNEIPHSGVAVLTDVGENQQIHPARKKQAGDRLAGLALRYDYGKTGLDAESPAFVSKSVSGNAVTLTFDKELKPGTVDASLFEIAAAGSTSNTDFTAAATATVNGHTVVISAASVPANVEVRYAYKNFVGGNLLFGANGLPVSSFRTDNVLFNWD